jgi:hypothetical protein
MLTDLNTVRKLAALTVLLTVAIAMSMGEVINRDGIIYVSAAQAFLDGGFDAAVKVYRWPFYSVIIGSVSWLSGFSLEISAQLVNGILMLLLVDGFIRLSHSLEDFNSQPWIAALLVLSFPAFEHRLEIYRDWGYLAFVLNGLVAFVRYWKHNQGSLADALTWQFSIIIALLFRVEAIGLMLMLPVLFVFHKSTWKVRIQRYLTVNLVLWVSLFCALTLILMGILPAGKFADLSAYLNFHKLLGSFNQTAELISEYALNKHTDDYAQLMLVSGIASMIVSMVMDNLGEWLILLTLVGWYLYRLPKIDNYHVVYWLLLLVFITLFVFMMAKLMAISRFALLGSVLVLLFTTHYVSQFYTNRNSGHAAGKYWWWFVLTGLLLGNLNSIAALPDYKGYMRQGGGWIQENLSPDVPLISNDSIIEYYARRPHGEKLDTFEKVEKAMLKTPKPYYVSLKVDDDEMTEVLALMGQQPIAEFRSNRADESLLVFEVK